MELLSLLVSCSNEQPTRVAETKSDSELRGFKAFKSNALLTLGDMNAALIDNGGVMTRSESELLPEFQELTDELATETYFFLEMNDIDIEMEGFVDENDPRLAIVGLALIEAEQIGPEGITVGGCVLNAIGVTTAAKTGAKIVFGKAAVKAVLKRVPYLGAAVMAADFAWCMYKKYSDGVMVQPYPEEEEGLGLVKEP